ncbi:MAG TPA: ABC transporter permease [Vicinamibacterales bacterium]|nr:ABC transporter permease [Vicinamibacterales bacterium]
MSTLVQDVRYALRMLLRTRGFTAVAVITLALGIGANTALFSIVYGVLLKPLPFERPDGLVMLWSKPGRGRGGATSPADFLDYRRMNAAFEDLAAMNTVRAALTGRGEPVIARGAEVSAGFFRILRVQPARGRTFTAEEDRAGAPRVVVLSDALWRERFGADPRVVGRAITLNGNPYTVTGIMPPAFDFPRLVTNERTEFWVPIAFDEARAQRGGHYLAVVGRLKPGVTLAAAQAQMDTIASRLQRQYPETNTNWVVNLFTLHEEIVSDARSALLILTGAVGFVLLIACANVANLLLARATSRAKELAVRSALGAASGRLLRQLLTESLVLSLAGALVGALLAAWGLEFAKAITGEWLPRSWEVSINAPVLLFTIAAAVVTGVLFGLAPGLHVTRSVLNDALKSGGRSTGTSSQQRLRTAFVVTEVALAFVLLIGAGLLIRSFQQLQQVRPGFQPDSTMTAVLSLPDARYSTLTTQAMFADQLLARVRSIKDVRRAALASFVPFDGKETLLTFSVQGEPDPRPADRRLAQWRVVSDGFFETLGVPLVKGRTFSPSDTETAPRVAVVSTSLARKYFPSKDPIGQRVTLDDLTDPKAAWFTIVGVVDNVRYRSLATEPRPLLYYAASQQQFPEFTLVARTAGDPVAIVPSLRAIVRALDPVMPLQDVRTLNQVVSTSMAGERFRTSLLVALALIALVLAAVGVYGVMAYSVEQRTQEMGLRMALGASPRDVLRLVTGHGVRLTALGIVLGAFAAWGLTRVLASALFGVTPTDPVTFAGMALLLAFVASLASYIPARRATKADPMLVLRTE